MLSESAKSHGHIVQVDAMDVRPLPGVAFQRFAPEMFFPWDVFGVSIQTTVSSVAFHYQEH